MRLLHHGARVNAVAFFDGDGLSRLAQEYQPEMREATGLSCSIGVTPNKLLSKIASDLEKPGGLTLVPDADIPDRASLSAKAYVSTTWVFSPAQPPSTRPTI